MTLCAVMHAAPHNERSHRVTSLLDAQKIPYRLYEALEWKGFAEKIKTAFQASQELTDFTHLLFIDAYDVLALAGPEKILERFRAFDHPWVCAAEPNIWPPDAFVPDEYPPCDTPWRFLNSGMYLAEREYLQNCLFRWDIPETIHSDQFWFTRHYLQEPGCITLDTHCTLFQCLMGGWWTFNISPGRLENTLMQTTPLLLHHNGGGRLDEERMKPLCQNLTV